LHLEFGLFRILSDFLQELLLLLYGDLAVFQNRLTPLRVAGWCARRFPDFHADRVDCVGDGVLQIFAEFLPGFAGR
jgi:hypothetical protein